MLRSDKKERAAASAVSATIASITAFALIATCAIPGSAQAYAEQSTTLPNCQDPAWCSEAPSGTAEPCPLPRCQDRAWYSGVYDVESCSSLQARLACLMHRNGNHAHSVVDKGIIGCLRTWPCFTDEQPCFVDEDGDGVCDRREGVDAKARHGCGSACGNPGFGQGNGRHGCRR